MAVEEMPSECLSSALAAPSALKQRWMGAFSWCHPGELGEWISDTEDMCEQLQRDLASAVQPEAVAALDLRHSPACF